MLHTFVHDMFRVTTNENNVIIFIVLSFPNENRDSLADPNGDHGGKTIFKIKIN